MNLNAFLSTLPIMAQGLSGIFIVTGVIVLVMVVLSRLTSGRKTDKGQEE